MLYAGSIAMPNCEIKRGQLCTLTGALGPTSSSVTILNMTMMTQFQYQSEEYIILSNISNKNQYQLKYIKRYNISFYLNLSQEVISIWKTNKNNNLPSFS